MVSSNIKIMFLMLTGLAFFLSTSAFAQMRGMDVEARVNQMKERLSLDSSQVAGITKILKNSQEKMQATRDQYAGNREEMRKAMGELRQDNDKKIEALLNDKQKEEYKKMQDEMMQRMRERRGNG